MVERNPNKPHFFSDENFEMLFAEDGEEAVYADWMPGIGEHPSVVAQIQPRPPGDESTLHWINSSVRDTGR